MVAALGLGGCKPDRATTRPDASATETVAPTGEAVAFASKGVPHGAAISLVAVDLTGTAALSRDTFGSVRLWPALDGSREPLVVPVRDPRAMTLGADGAGGWVLALLDGSGGARIVGVDAVGVMTPLASLPPTDPLTAIEILPGGDRLVAIGSDHVIRLLDRKGRELARLDTPGLRPAHLRIVDVPTTETATGGPRVLAVTAGEFDSDHSRFAVELLPLEIGPESLAFADQRQLIQLDSPPSRDNPTLAPDGNSVVFLQRQRMGGAIWAVVATALDDGRSVIVDSPITGGQQPRLGLLPGGRVLLDDGTGLGRVVDMRKRQVELIAMRSSPTINHLIMSFGGGKRVGPAGSWLAVHTLASDELLYLGYEQINVMDVGLSPAGETVAWALNDRVLTEAIEPTTHHLAVEIPGTRMQPQRFVEFLDDELLVTLDWSGGLQVIRWREGVIVSAADLGGDTQLAELARDGHGGGVMFVRTNLWQNPTVVELRSGAIGGRYLTHLSAQFSGVLAPAGAPLDDWGAWTLDASGKLRTFTLAALREGVDIGSVIERGELTSFGIPENLAIDAAGQQLWLRTLTRPTLHIERGTVRDELELAPGFVAMLVPSRDAKRIAVVQQRDATHVLTVLDSASLRPVWAQPVPALSGLSWSDTGARLAAAANVGGGVVFDGSDGSPTLARCGLAFEVRRTPPNFQGFFHPFSVCDL